MASYAITQSTTTWALMFMMVQSSDHVTPLTGASPTVTLSKNGAAFGAAAGATTEIANGWYKVAGNATDTNTLGPLVLHATAASGDPTDFIYEVVAYNPQSTGLGLTNVSANAVQINGVSTASVTTVNANVGTTQPQNFTGTGGSALVKSDMVDIAGAAVSTTTAQIGANAVQVNGQTTSAAGTVTFPGTIASPSNITSGTITTVTNLTNAPTAGDFTATMKTSLNAATPASVTGAVGSVTGNVGGSVASVTARVTANTDQLAGQTVAAATGVTFPGSVASPTNITAGTVTTTTNLTNAPTAGDFTATMKTSLNAATPASVTGAVGSVTGNVGGSVASVTARVTANTDQLAGQTVAAAAGVTFPASVASPTNITSGTITNLTNAPTAGDFTAAMKTSLNAATPASVGSVTAPVTVSGASLLTEAYATAGAGFTLAQALYGLTQQIGSMSITGTTMTVKKRDGTTTAKTYTLNDATTPTAISETT